MNTKGKQQALERFVFNEFAKVCPLPVVLGSVESRNPPEPDIFCRLEAGDTLAVEPVSVEDVIGFDKFGNPIAATKNDTDSALLHGALQDAYVSAVTSGSIKQPERFEHHTIEIVFQPFASPKQRENAVPHVLALLNELGPGEHVIRSKPIQLIDCEKLSDSIAGPLFLQDSYPYYVSNFIAAGIGRKLEKETYKTDHSIHLLAWSQTASHAELGCWQDELTTLLRSSGMGPFNRVWVFGLGESSVIFDSAADMPPQ